MTQKDERDYILGCYQEDEDLTNAFYDAMEAYIAGDTHTGDQKMDDTKDLYGTTMASCDRVTSEMEQLEKQWSDLTSRSDWDTLSQQIYLANKAEVDTDVGFEFREWTLGVYFNSGMFAAYVEKIFLSAAPGSEPGPSPPATPASQVCVNNHVAFVLNFLRRPSKFNT